MTKDDKIILFGSIGLALLIIAFSGLFTFLTGAGLVGFFVFLCAFSICAAVGIASSLR